MQAAENDVAWRARVERRSYLAALAGLPVAQGLPRGRWACVVKACSEKNCGPVCSKRRRRAQMPHGEKTDWSCALPVGNFWIQDCAGVSSACSGERLVRTACKMGQAFLCPTGSLSGAEQKGRSRTGCCETCARPLLVSSPFNGRLVIAVLCLPGIVDGIARKLASTWLHCGSLPECTSVGRFPSSASTAGPGRSAAWAAATGEEPGGALEDCEDFVGRAWELRWLLRLLGAAGGRRVVVLHGAWGSGKSALAAEFCRYAAAPGRRFSDVRAPGGEGRQKRLALVSLQDAGGAGAEARASRLLQTAAAGLCSGSPADSACLVVDQAEEHLGWHDALAAELLQGNPWLHLLLVRSQPVYKLEGTDRWKPQNFGLPPLSGDEGARLFLSRVHRPLTELDFDAAAPGQHLPGAPLSRDVLIPRLADHPLIIACLGNPRRLVNLAARVTFELPSVRDLMA
ncbi:unnamed protein product [Prorocentrum cordatum]|uniref:Orc1-like AAA ATPase domain-containing protein n=1 Tax=Prorocentrum cordatum TaxID=2364126 RepID=A0ABN9WRQ1_9DINO|nr:unnamed protein product [Polarella glacialis]